MRALDRKLLRDAWHYRGQMAAIALVVLCGVALFVTLRSMNAFLRESRDSYYATYRFPDVFAHLKRAPVGLVERVEEIAGVRAVYARSVFDVTLDVPGLSEPATGRIVSIPVPRTPMLNELHLLRGRWPSPDRPREVLASSAFSRANALDLGDSLGAVLNGRWQWLTVTGVAMSPEFVYEIGQAAVFPDNRRFGVLWMGSTAVSTAFDMEGAFNDLVLTLGGASESAVIAEVDALLDQYGGLGAYGRNAQISNQFLEGEIEETQVTSVLLPGIFLGVTAFLLHLVLGRLVTTQRDQIAALKAFGYSNTRIGIHFVQLSLIPLIAGSVAGAVVGTVLAARLAGVYARFFQFPFPEFTGDWGIAVVAIVSGCAAGVAGAAGAVVGSASLPPAEAMRPEAPARFRRGILEWGSWMRRASPALRIIVRNLERRPMRTVLSVCALALAVGIVVTTRSMFDSIDRIKHVHFTAAAREDVTVTFRSAASADALRSLRRLTGVTEVEGFRVVPVRLQAGNRRYQAVIRSGGGRLHRIVDQRGREQRAPEGGMVLSAALAEILRVGAGDRVMVEVLEGSRRKRETAVSAVVDDLIGTGAYMQASELERVAGDGAAVSGAYLRVDPAVADSVFVQLKRLPLVSGVAVRAAELEGFERTIAESFRISLLTAMGFAAVIAFGIVYNSARVTLSERGRELASLRVLGFSRKEVARMLLGEQAILTIASVPLGFGVAYFFAWLISVRFESELFRLPVVVAPMSYLVGAGILLASAATSALAVRRRINRLDMIAVLKTRE